jgi:hypothetical protein
MREFKKECTIVIFVGTEPSARSKELFEQFQVLAIPYKQHTIPSDRILTFHPATLESKYSFPRDASNYSRSLVRDGISEASGKVLLADVRDTAFQSDPFGIVPFPGEGVEIAHESRNVGWVKDGWVEQVFVQVATKEILCSGIVTATFKISSSTWKHFVRKYVLPSLRSVSETA